MDAPKYQQSSLDPNAAALAASSQQQELGAVGSGLRRDSASLVARYGDLTQADRAWLLSRYGSQLALAGQGGKSLASGFIASGQTPV